MELDDDVRRADDHRFVRRLRCFACDIAERGVPTGDAAELVQTTDSSADIHAPQRACVAADDERRSRAPQSADAIADGVKSRSHVTDDAIAFRRMPGQPREIADRL